MSKRTADSNCDGGSGLTALKDGQRPLPDLEKLEDQVVYEDDFEDEFESEDEIFEAGVDGRPDAEREAEELKDGMEVDTETFIVGRHKLAPGQVLTPDLSAYKMLHSLNTPWPCLSFDLVRDGMGDSRDSYPATIYTVAGTQADSVRSQENQLMVMKFSGLSRMSLGDDQSSDDEAGHDSDEDAEPILESKSIPLNSITNRIRAHRIPSQELSDNPTVLTATMLESATVLIHNVTPHLASFDNPGTVVSAQQGKPVCTIRAHKAEGYAVDWSPLVPAGKLATGDNDGLIYLTTGTNGGNFTTDSRPFRGHSGSVEDIQWSASEPSVFASASSDNTVRVWDIRSKSRAPAITMRVSKSDVNVLSWSRQTTHLLASGHEDGDWAVWDLRQWKSGTSAAGTVGDSLASPIAHFQYHKEQISSIEWHPSDDSIIAVAAGDNTVTLWDLAVELDDEECKDSGGVGDIPPQLLFVHVLQNVKEVHWHPQILGSLVATGDEFSIFQTISV